jgi:hypothetical protein
MVSLKTTQESIDALRQGMGAKTPPEAIETNIAVMNI